MRNQLFRHGCHHLPGIVAGLAGEDLTAVIGQGRSALTAPPLAPRTLDSSQFTFLGSGMSVGIANEAALKLREASQSWTESYPAMNSVTVRSAWSGEHRRSGCSARLPGLLEDLDVTGAHVESSDLDAMADLIRRSGWPWRLRRPKDSIPTSPGTWHGQSCSPDMTAMRRGTIRMSFTAILSLESTSAAPQSRPPSSIPTDSNTVSERPTPRHLGPDAVNRNNHSRDRRAQSAGTEAAWLRAGPCGPRVVDAQQGIAVYAANIGWQAAPCARSWRMQLVCR